MTISKMSKEILERSRTELPASWRQECFMTPRVRNRQGPSASQWTPETSPDEPTNSNVDALPLLKRAEFSPESYTEPFLKFMTENPTVFHAVSYFSNQLNAAGFTELNERSLWKNTLKKGGKYFVTRNGSALIAFVVGDQFEAGNGAAIIAGHIDALTARLKPIPTLKTKAGFDQLGVAPYAGALNGTWWDRDLGIGGKVIVKDPKTGKIEPKLVALGWPIARIPTLAPHFGASGPFNRETQMVPIIGLNNSDITGKKKEETDKIPANTFAATQPERLVKAISKEMGITDYGTIMNWELELYDTQPAQLGGLDKEFIFAGRIDDKLCSYAAVEALLASIKSDESSSILKIVGLFDNEEIGSLLRQGARSNFLSSVMERICETFVDGNTSADTTSAMYANSFLVSSDVIHAVNPNFLNAYLENHAPRLNIGVSISCDSNGHMTTDSVSTAVLTQVASKCGSTLQLFQIRNDSRSGGTIGPMTSSQTGIRAIDCGIPQLSMHSIRATTGSLDPGLGVKLFKGVFDYYEEVDKAFA
ncbi:MAG: hypothetical protein M1834_005155 [Cirrosporium novae-zelandiae]|nr:MAG: hypothetical protein M1834_005155 [Cirrosporium novae-zelandiae]